MKRKNKHNQGSSVLALCLLAGVLGGMAVMTALLISKFNLDSKASERRGSANLDATQFSLLLTSMRYQFTGTNLPLWYPDTYPTQSELKATKKIKPLIQVLAPLADKSNAMTTVVEKINGSDREVEFKYDLDKTNMGAVLNPTDSRAEIQAGRSQPAYVSFGDMTQLSTDALKDFFTSPNASWPHSGAKLTSLKSVKIYFDSYDTETLPDKSVLIKGLNVTVEQGGSRNSATFLIDTPPAPTCEITPASGTQPFVSGQTVQFNFKTTSITNAATFENKKSSTDFTIATQSIRNLYKATPVSTSGTFSLVVPDANSLLVANADGTKRWIVKGSVTGVDSRKTPSTCFSADLKVQPPELDCRSVAAVVDNTTVVHFVRTDKEVNPPTYQRYMAVKYLFPTWDPYGRAGGATDGVSFSSDDDTHLALCNLMGYQSRTGTRVTNRWRSPNDNGAMRFYPATKQFRQIAANINNYHTNGYDCVGKLVQACYDDPRWIAKLPPPPPPPPPPVDCRSSAAVASNTTEKFSLTDNTFSTTYQRYVATKRLFPRWDTMILGSSGKSNGGIIPDNDTHQALCNLMGYQSASGTRVTYTNSSNSLKTGLLFMPAQKSFVQTRTPLPMTFLLTYECTGKLVTSCYSDPSWIAK